MITQFYTSLTRSLLSKQRIQFVEFLFVSLYAIRLQKLPRDQLKCHATIECVDLTLPKVESNLFEGRGLGMLLGGRRTEKEPLRKAFALLIAKHHQVHSVGEDSHHDAAYFVQLNH